MGPSTEATKAAQYMYVMGGQSFINGDEVYLNDVWRSADGIYWTVMTASAQWWVLAAMYEMVAPCELLLGQTAAT